MIINDKKVKVSLRTRVMLNDEIMFGSGVSSLLQETKISHSLHAASKKLNMTYRKALQIVNRAEAVLDKKILQKKIGGAKGGGSELTKFGEKLVLQFSLFERELQDIAEEKFANYMQEVLYSD